MCATRPRAQPVSTGAWGEGQEPVFPYDVCVLCFLARYGDQSGHL